MYIRPLAITGELRKVPKVHILPSWLYRCPEAGHEQQIVCSLTPCRFYHGHRIAITPPQDRHNLLVREL
jgi:hypothetical protein